MNRLKTSFEKAKNPLRIVLVLLVLYGLLGVYSLFKLAVTSGISPAILERSNLIVLPLIIMLFVFCYIKKTMWAFWVAASVFPTVTLYVYLQDSPTAHEWIALVIFNLIVFGYLASKLEGYENFLRFHKSLKTDNENRDVNTSEKGRLLGKNKDGEVSSHTGFSEGQSSQNALLRINDKNTKSFSFLALAAVIGIVFNFYRLYNIYQLQNGLQSVFQTELSSIFAIVFMAMFLVLYCI